MGAFVDEVMTRGGVSDQLSVDLAGAGFEAAILIGGIILGGYVDRTKKYKQVTMACLLTTAFMCIVSVSVVEFFGLLALPKPVSNTCR